MVAPIMVVGGAKVPGVGGVALWSRDSLKVVLKISAMVLRAETFLSERGEIGEAGCDDRSAAIKSRAAAMPNRWTRTLVCVPWWETTLQCR